MSIKRECVKFVIRIALIHVLTYIVCGMLAMFIFDYQSSFSQMGMRDTSSIIVGLSPLFQIVRGCLFGLIFWIVKDAFLYKKNGWLIIWLLILILGIFNTPSTAPGSIEYFIYCEPILGAWKVELGGLIEILAQTFLFSVLSFHFVKPRTK